MFACFEMIKIYNLWVVINLTLFCLFRLLSFYSLSLKYFFLQILHRKTYVFTTYFINKINMYFV